jgi:hypothetical protein
VGGWVKLLLASTLVFFVLRQVVRITALCTLQHDEANALWILIQPNCKPLSGRLVKAGYRSAWLVILAIQTEDTVIHRTVVWHDQVNGLAFSYLHHQLAYAAAAPVRRTGKAWLAGLVVDGPWPTLALPGRWPLRLQCRKHRNGSQRRLR